MQKHHNLIFLVLISLGGIFLRVFKIGSNYYFTGELGKELLYLRSLSLAHKIPLVGLATSHEWLNYGPIYYWIMLPIFHLFRGDPFILFWTALVVSILGLILGYFVMVKIAGTRLAIFYALILSFSPLIIWLTRESKLHVFFLILTPLFMYLLFLVWNGGKKWIFWAGLTFGIMFSFHYSQIPLIGVVILLFYLKKRIYKYIHWLVFAAGLVLGNVTLLINDATHGFVMSRDLIFWIPYRILGFTGLYPKNNLSKVSVVGTLQSFNEFIGKNIFWDQRLWTLGTIIFVVIFIHFVVTKRKSIGKDFLTFYIISSISFVFLANFIHTEPPIHYFLPVFMIVPILFAIYLEKSRFWFFVITPLILVNMISFSHDPEFYGKIRPIDPKLDMIPYSEQLSLVSFIVHDADGKNLSIKRIGPYDYFPEQYSQNYKYLILYEGGNLIENSPNVYTVKEDVVKGTISIQK